MNLNNETYKYFKPYEFECCIPKCSINDMDKNFLGLLDSARGLAGVPFGLIVRTGQRNMSWVEAELDLVRILKVLLLILLVLTAVNVILLFMHL